MRIENSPAAYGWLVGLLVFLLGLIANAGCHPRGPQVSHTRSYADRAFAAVRIETDCGTGSGVLLDGHTVLTAFHVVNCADYPEIKAPKVIIVHGLEHRVRTVERVFAQSASDTARLELDGELPGATPVDIRDALLGESICASTGFPERTVRCGVVDSEPGDRSEGDIHVAGIDLWFGNSGSGVYSKDGALVGVVVRLNWCSADDAWWYALTGTRPDRTCGGRVSSLTDTPVLP